MKCSKCDDNVYKLYEVSYVIHEMRASVMEDFVYQHVIDSDLCQKCAYEMARS